MRLRRLALAVALATLAACSHHHAPPSAPSTPVATAGNAQASISWTDVSGATSYNLYYSTTSGAGKAGTKVASVTSPHVVTGLSNGTTYYFVVTAVGSGGESVASGQASATPQQPPPAAPTGVAAVAGNGQASVSWSAAAGATSYNLYYSTTSGAGTAGTKVSGATSPQVVASLANGTPYYFVVTAVGPGGEGAASTQATATPLAPPAAPTGVGAAAGNGQVTVTWSAASGATSYNVYYSTSSGAGTSGTKVAGATSPQVIGSLANGTTYYIVVTAVGAGGESAASSEASATPILVSTVTVKSVSGATNTSAAVATNGTLWVWGANTYDFFGPGNPAFLVSRTQVGTATNWKSVGASGTFAVAIKTDGTMWSWGLNDYGQLGHSAGTTFVFTPTQIGTDTWLQVAVGGSTSAAIRSDGTLWAWGQNDGGQLGLGNNTGPSICPASTPAACATTPQQVGSLNSWTKVGLVGQTFFAIRSDGTLWAWGNNTFGQLGIGNNTGPTTCTPASGYAMACATSPVQVGTATNWASIAAEGDGVSPAALRTDGTLWVWGNNKQGQLGLGSKTGPDTCTYTTIITFNMPCAMTPQQLGTGTWLSADIANYTGAGVRSDGTLWVWGQGSTGLGNAGGNESAPGQVGSGTNWKSVFQTGQPGNDFGLLTDTSDTLWAWGSNNAGQLGQGATSGVVAAPVTVP